MSSTEERGEVTATRHAEQIESFRAAVAELGSVLGTREVAFGATISTQSGSAHAMLAPVRIPSVAELLDRGGIIAAFYVTAGVQDHRTGPKLGPGTYAIRFTPRRTSVAFEFVSASGELALTRPGLAGFGLGRGEDLLKKAKAAAKKKGFDIKVIDIEILFGGGKNVPSEVRGSFLFWSFHLFDDP